jgi:putative oxidoreductase
MSSFYTGLVAVGENLQSLFLLAIRLFWGYQFMLAGWGKVQDINKVAGFFAELGIPLVTVSTYAASYTEFIGGILLIIGFASRLAAIPLMFTMIVAHITAHWNTAAVLFSDPLKFVGESPFTFLFASLIIFIFGPGKFSIDYLLERMFFRGKAS